MAKDLRVGDEFSMRVTCRVLTVEPAEPGEKEIGIRVLLLEKGSTLFLGEYDDRVVHLHDLVVHLRCRPSRKFHTARETVARLYEEWRKERLAELDADSAEPEHY
jgi:hypothetical protein